MRTYFASIFTTFVVFTAFASEAALAQPVDKTTTAGSYRLELEVLPPEPFFSQSEVQSQQVQSGMLVVRGAAPLQPNASPRPDHHLVVHVFDKSTGKAVTGADVRMGFQRLAPGGEPSGPVTRVPVVEMQVIGKGPQTTHYGNNVSMPPGTYRVTVTVNAATAEFKVTT